jgi:ABC-type transporter Mla MlaB component
MTTRFGVDVSRAPQPAHLMLVGELDQAGVSELEATFRLVGTMHGRSNVVIDVSALEFCDSAGWHALERCREQGATLHGSAPCLRRLVYLIRHAHLLPADLHELRGLEREKAQELLAETARAA